MTVEEASGAELVENFIETERRLKVAREALVESAIVLEVLHCTENQALTRSPRRESDRGVREAEAKR